MILTILTQGTLRSLLFGDVCMLPCSGQKIRTCPLLSFSVLNNKEDHKAQNQESLFKKFRNYSTGKRGCSFHYLRQDNESTKKKFVIF